jgi:DNA mismatch repair protein MutL
MLHSPPKIDLLPEHLIDQIKAGEVIERPGNLIKEILENAIDAKATKLELTIKENGLTLISLKDNGHGMHGNDLPIAFSRHATSKISRFEDLYRLHSFGFRGEALASIAAISRLQCISKTMNDDFAGELRIEGGQTLYHGERKSSPFAHGTELIIQDLFFNTPARLKFIQSQQSEKNFIKKIVFSFILSRPDIEFQIKFDDAEKDIYVARSHLLERIQDIFPKAKDSILHLQRFYENVELDLFLIPGTFKSPLKIQNIHINDRYILDKQLHRVLSHSLDAAFGDDEYHYMAQFNLPPDTIDVNVHPNKTIIKVMDHSKMMGVLSSSIKSLALKKGSSHTSTTSGKINEASHQQTILPEVQLTSGLQQERHQYNMDGLFSPHDLSQNHDENDLWIGKFIIKKNGSSWIALAPTKLLELYCYLKIRLNSPTIPLLVSEPFNSKKIKPEIIHRLQVSGMELEYLGPETLVVRGIPDWMNGFPLKELIYCLLHEKSFNDLVLNPSDWSLAIWDEMLSSFSWEELISKKIILDLPHLLNERFK